MWSSGSGLAKRPWGPRFESGLGQNIFWTFQNFWKKIILRGMEPRRIMQPHNFDSSTMIIQTWKSTRVIIVGKDGSHVDQKRLELRNNHLSTTWLSKILCKMCAPLNLNCNKIIRKKRSLRGSTLKIFQHLQWKVNFLKVANVEHWRWKLYKKLWSF